MQPLDTSAGRWFRLEGLRECRKGGERVVHAPSLANLVILWLMRYALSGGQRQANTTAKQR